MKTIQPTSFTLPHPFKAIVLAAALASSLTTKAATDITVGVSYDTTISEHPGLGLGVEPLGDRDQVFVIAPSGYRSSALVWFDLSPFTGQSLVADAKLRMTVFAVYSYVSFEARPVQTFWDEATVTLSNFGEPFGAVVSNGFADEANPDLVEGYLFEIMIPQAVIQGFIDDPSTNYGIALTPTGGRDLYFASREFVPVNGTEGDWAPKLSLTVASAPESLPGLAGAVGALALAVRRARTGLKSACTLNLPSFGGPCRDSARP